jgi:tetratricopeptide (TPR) repeat protein
MIHDALGRQESAIASYKLAVFLGEQRPAVIRKLVQLLTARGEHLAAEEVIRKLGVNSPNLLDGLERERSRVAFFGRNTQQALELAEKVASDSKDYRDHVWLGQLYWATQMPKEAEASLVRALALNDQVPEPWVAMVQHLVRVGDVKKAAVVVVQAEEKLPKGTALLDLAQCYEMVEKTFRARELYEAALEASPKDATVLYHVAMYCWRSFRPDDAKVHLKTILRLETRTPEQVAKARRALAKMVDSAGNYMASQAALKILEGSEEETPTEPTTTDNVADLRAKVAILAHQPSARKRREAIGILQELIRKRMATIDEKFLLARLHESVGDWVKMRSQMTDLLSTVEERLAASSNEREKKALQAAYGNHLAYLCLNLVRRGELSDAPVWQAKLEALEPDTMRSLEVKGRLLAKQDRAAEIVPILQKLVAKDRAKLRPVAAILEQIGQVELAREMFERYVAQTKEPEAALVLAAFLGRQGRCKEALKLCEAAWTSAAPEKVAAVCVAILYETKSGTADPADAAQVATWLGDAIAKTAGNAQLENDLVAVRRLQGRNPDAVALLRAIAKREKTDVLALNNLAWLLALTGKADEALDAVQQAINFRGELAELLDTRAVAHLVKGQHALAIKDLEEIVAEAPTAHRYFHLAQARIAAGNTAGALDALRLGKGLGLTEATVDPLERTAYGNICAKLDRP